MSTSTSRKMPAFLCDGRFVPHQPYLEFNSNYQSYVPDMRDPLFGIVWEVYEVSNCDTSKCITLPDLCADLMVLYTSEKAYCYFMCGETSTGSMERFDFFPRVHTVFGVKFCTGSLGVVCRDMVKDMDGRAVDGLDAIRDGREMILRLMEADTFSERWFCVRDYLCMRCHAGYDVNCIAKYVAGSVISSHGRISISDLEDETGYSGRYLRKNVQLSMGVTIKQLSEIAMFQWTYHLFRESGGRISLSELAVGGGYYDQSHMNLSCKKLTGRLPRTILGLYMQPGQ